MKDPHKKSKYFRYWTTYIFVFFSAALSLQFIAQTNDWPFWTAVFKIVIFSQIFTYGLGCLSLGANLESDGTIRPNIIFGAKGEVALCAIYLILIYFVWGYPASEHYTVFVVAICVIALFLYPFAVIVLAWSAFSNWKKTHRIYLTSVNLYVFASTALFYIISQPEWGYFDHAFAGTWDAFLFIVDFYAFGIVNEVLSAFGFDLSNNQFSFDYSGFVVLFLRLSFIYSLIFSIKQQRD